MHTHSTAQNCIDSFVLSLQLNMNRSLIEQTNLLVTAAAENDTATIRRVLAGSDRHQLLGNALVTAIDLANPDAVEELISLGAPVDIHLNNVYKGYTPLHLAAERRSLKCVKLLAHNAADVNKVTAVGSPLHVAAGEGITDIVSFLIDEGCDVNAQAKECKNTVLSRSFDKDSIDVCNILLKAGADINIVNSLKETPLHVACDAGALRCVERLLQCGANIDALDKTGRTPLFSAVCGKHEAIVRLLCRKGASIYVFDQQQLSVLSLAIHLGALNILRILLQMGANLDISQVPKFDNILITALTPCQHGWTDSTSYAKVNEEIELFDLLIEARANLAAKSTNGTSLLQSCVTEGCRPRLEYLVNTCVPCCTMTNDRKTALTLACDNRNSVAAMILIKLCPSLLTYHHERYLPLLNCFVTQLDILPLRLLLEAGYLYRRAELVAAMQDAVAERASVHLLEAESSQPWSMQRCCQTVIRQLTRLPLACNVRRLPLPWRLQERILLNHVWKL